MCVSFASTRYEEMWDILSRNLAGHYKKFSVILLKMVTFRFNKSWQFGRLYSGRWFNHETKEQRNNDK